MSMASTNKTALVTGASRGIGAAVALELASKGYTVVINYRIDGAAAAEVARQIAAVGGHSIAIQADVANEAQVAAMFDRIDRELGRIDVLVCSAGIVRDTLLGASEAGDFDDVFAVNVGGVVNCCRQASRRMVSARRGAIVTLSSVAASRPGRGQSNYAASKGAVEAFTKALAVELAPRGIRVNGVAPGVIATDMSAQIRALAPEELNKRILLKRAGGAQEVAKVVAFLCSDDASYVTAQVWHVDGGFKAE
ncbi:MAG: SDR family NAD(P)-dependent oxidoreductase [Pseudomonadota bacterium]